MATKNAKVLSVPFAMSLRPRSIISAPGSPLNLFSAILPQNVHYFVREVIWIDRGKAIQRRADILKVGLQLRG
jgi:hypothetical protein